MTEPAPDLNAGVLAPVADEVLLEGPEVVGELPRELNGTLIRNGPNPFEGRFEGDGMLHWWTGPAMVHGVAFAEGRALWYRNRWVRTAAWRSAHGRSGSEDDLGPQNPNVNVLSHAGQILALGESSLPFALDEHLETRGPETFGGALPAGMAAHPKIDPVTGELVFFRASWQPPFLWHGVLDAAGKLKQLSAVETSAPTMMHDFAITASYSLLLDLGVGFDPRLLARGQPLPIRWLADKPCRIGVLPREGNGSVRWFEIGSCFIQHVANAWERDGCVVLEVVRYPEFLRFDEKRNAFAENPLGVLWRYEIDIARGSVRETQVDDRCVELPRIDERRTGHASRTTYVVEQPSDHEMRGVAAYDSATGRVQRYHVPPGDQNSEPVFVPRPGGSDERDGWLLVCVYRRSTDRSDLVVLDAQAIDREPLATVRLASRIPAGFHGSWIEAG